MISVYLPLSLFKTVAFFLPHVPSALLLGAETVAQAQIFSVLYIDWLWRPGRQKSGDKMTGKGRCTGETSEKSKLKKNSLKRTGDWTEREVEVCLSTWICPYRSFTS